MKTIFVSRHRGAAEWAARHGFAEAQVVPHFTPNGEAVCVIGTLPVHLAAQVCAAGGEYWHLSLDIPYWARERELTADDMESFGARIERFVALPATAVRDKCNYLANVAYHDGMAPFHDFGIPFGV